VLYSLNAITMQLGVKGACDLARGTGESDQAASGGNLFDRESVGREPASDLRQLWFAGSKLGSKLGGREPLLIMRRARILLRFHQGIECGLLFRSGRKHE